jgi:hypothetical protein
VHGCYSSSELVSLPVVRLSSDGCCNGLIDAFTLCMLGFIVSFGKVPASVYSSSSSG